MAQFSAEGGSLRFGGTSRMTRECHVRICERLGVKFPPLCSNLHHQYICGADHVVYYHGLYYSRRSR